MEELNQKRKMTFVFSTHDARVVKRARRVVTLKDGEVFGDKVLPGDV
jgi:putative ABC transport system ATP-binding protein